MTRYMLFGLLAAVPSIVAYARLRRLVVADASEVKPNIASWLPWLAVDASIFWASVSSVPRIFTSVIVFGIYTLGSSLIVLSIFNRGKIKLSIVDKISLLASVIAFILWKSMNDPAIAIYLNCIVIISATVPTVYQAWLDPNKEDVRVWTYFLIGGLINLFAVEKWDMVHGLPAIALITAQVALVVASSKKYMVRLSTITSW